MVGIHYFLDLKQSTSIYRLNLAILTLLFLINVWIFWPGQMVGDSYWQYQAARTAVYGDHHPPMISVVWRFLDYLIPGSGLMMLLHLSMLYAASAIFILAANPIISWIYIFLPLIPPISFYSTVIWKDVGFSFAFLLATALISYFIMHDRKPSIMQTFLILALLFYGTALKFQAMYVLPIPLFWLSFCFTKFTVNFKTILLSVISSVGILVGIEYFNNHYVPKDHKAHSWQFVKLYDLAAISICTNKELFPSFCKSQFYSFDSVRKRFNHERVDDLIGTQNAPLCTGTNEDERNTVLQVWKSAVFQFPQYYVWHRFCNWWRMVDAIPIAKLESLDFSHYKGLNWFCKIQHYAQSPIYQSDLSESIIIALSKLLFAIFALLRHVLRISLLLPFLIAYFFIGIGNIKKNPAAIPLLLMTSIALAMLATLFFFSMASTIRYMYITICMIHACHGFAYQCIKKL